MFRRCPCGEVPTGLDLEFGYVTKWDKVTPNCCGEWMIEFRTGYLDPDSKEMEQLKIKVWNEAPRG